MRKLKRYDEMKAEIAAMPIKLSARDKNLVALFWLLEIVLTAIVGMDDEHKPEHKKAMYEQITSGLFGDVKEIVRLVNDRFNNQINKVFGRDFQDELADTCVAVVTLFETMPPEAVKKVIQAAGISDEMIVKNWDK